MSITSLKKKYSILFTITAMFAFVSCDNIIGDDDVEVNAEASVSDISPGIGDEVTLDGSESVVSADADVDINWEVDTPDGSNAEPENPSELTTTIIPDVAGEYIATLTIIADGIEDTDTAVFSAEGGMVEISGSYSDDLTLTSDNIYIVTSDVSISDARLIIEPGTEIRFSQGQSLVIGSGGIIEANGTEQDSIIFTGTQQEAGWWDGILLSDSRHPDNSMDYVVIEYAGGDTFWSTSDGPAALVVGHQLDSNSADLTLTNSTIRYSDGAGMYVRSESRLPDSGSNTYTDNDLPVMAAATNIHYLDSESVFSGNSNDHVVVYHGSVSGADITWPALEVPYYAISSIELSGTDVSILAGATFVFDNQTSFELTNGSTINAQGNRDQPITFTASESQAGWWDGILISNSPSSSNLFDHVIVEYGGGDSFWGTADANANLVVGHRLSSNYSQLTMTNTTLRYSGGHGLYLRYHSTLNSTNNTFTSNEAGPVFLYDANIHMMDGASSFTGNNGNDAVFVESDGVDSGTQTWQALEVPYMMNGSIEVSGIEVTIEPGAEFAFTNQSSLTFREGAEYSIVGEAGNRILFTGTEESSGWWDGILLSNTFSSNNEIDYIEVAYAGGGTFWNTQDHEAALVVGHRLSSNAATATVTNSIFRDSDGVGIYVRPESNVNADICDSSVNTFENNAEGNCIVGN